MPGEELSGIVVLLELDWPDSSLSSANPSCVTLNMSLSLSVSQSPHLKNRVTYLSGLL